MLRRQPTSVTLTAADVEMFKQLVREQHQQKEPDALEDGDSEPDNVFMGRSIDRKRTRDLNSRLGIEDASEEPLFKRIHL
jgi:hypothetical protein